MTCASGEACAFPPSNRFRHWGKWPKSWVSEDGVLKKKNISWVCLKMYFLPGNLRFWLAATDVGWSPGWFGWTDGIQVDNSTWFSGDAQQPDSFGVGKEACVFLYAKHAALGDGSCSDTHYIFCEVPQQSIDCILWFSKIMINVYIGFIWQIYTISLLKLFENQVSFEPFCLPSFFVQNAE